MATAEINEQFGERIGDIDSIASDILKFLGSLKWTVALFALSIVIVMVGTMAQDEMNMQQVKDAYFTAWFSKLYIDDLVPQSFHYHETRYGATESNPMGFWVPFPGGSLIGLGLLINLLAAKVTRFRIRASGGKFALGLVFCVIGMGVLLAVIFLGSSASGLQGEPPSYAFVHHMVTVLLVLGIVGAIFGVVAPDVRELTRYLCGGVSLVLVGGLISQLMVGMDDAALRIVWQLAKGTGVAGLLLVGCNLLFGQQGGNLLLHFGIALLMIGQFTFSDRQLEQRLILHEREASNVLVDLDRLELAFIDQSSKGKTQVVAIPNSMLIEAELSGERIDDDRLPFDVEVVDYMMNSTFAKDPDENPADKGLGIDNVVEEIDTVGSTAENEINIASAYIKLFDKGKDESLGTYLVTQYANDREKIFSGGGTSDFYDTVESGDKEYEIALRYIRVPKPYWVKLTEVRRINYNGTATPRDYSSFVDIVDTETNIKQSERIWMNNPLRFKGETFYQSSYIDLPGGRKATVLQVVRNSGWLIPYIACGIVALGMASHFLGTLRRFIGRRERETRKIESAGYERSLVPVWGFVSLIVLTQTAMLVPWGSVRTSSDTRLTEPNLYKAGEIPVMFGGRVMPLDQFARQTLTVISNKERISTDGAKQPLIDRVGEKISAIAWLFEAMEPSGDVRSLRMFKIDAAEVLAEVGLEPREGKRYSFEELEPSFEKLQKFVDSARDKSERERSFKEGAILNLYGRLNQFLMINESFRKLQLAKDLPKEAKPEGMSEEDLQRALNRIAESRAEAAAGMGGPAMFPPAPVEAEIDGVQPDWRTYAEAAIDDSNAALDEETRVAGVLAFTKMRSAYLKGDAEKFNDALDACLAEIAEASPHSLVPWRVELERWLVGVKPSHAAMFGYIISMILALVCLLAKLPRLQLTTILILCFTLGVHTVYIVSRIAVTGRAPVINLYSSAVFIAWAGVFGGLALEWIYKHGLGNLVSSMCGVFGLLVSLGLNTGDTMPVLQAVLDTQFWLGTHVVTITLGYSATFLAGLLGVIYLMSSLARATSETTKMRRDLYRMMYGICCFGVLFSFVGTVLGGLWADDSWGRFWGWDPKENGALLIVIWNALMLHARWDGMVGERGFATLAIGGNIVTAWSWFGTNQLGFGLHAYGGQDSTKMLLFLFLISQLVLIAFGIINAKMANDTKSIVSSARRESE